MSNILKGVNLARHRHQLCTLRTCYASHLHIEVQTLVSRLGSACHLFIFSEGSLVSLDEVWSLVPQTYRERLQEERWTFITQQVNRLSRVMRKPTFWFPTRSDTDQAVQLQKIARGLKFRI